MLLGVLVCFLGWQNWSVNAQGPHGLNVTWTASASSGIAGYNVYRSAVMGGPYTKITTVSATVSSYLDPLTDGKKYYYTVTAVSLPPIVIESILSAEASNTAPLAPAQVTGVAVTPQ